MIQRIQSVYLLLATVLLGVVSKFPEAFGVGKGVDGGVEAVFVVAGKNQLLGSTTAFLAAFAVVTLLPLVTVFLYKKRKLQMQLCIVEMVLLLGVVGAIAYDMLCGVYVVTSISYFRVAILVVAFVFVWLAWRAIRRDERLVRSLDRIR